MSPWASNHDKRVLDMYGTTAPLMRIAKTYGIDYGDVLLYADCFCKRHYGEDNLLHTAPAALRISKLDIKQRTQLLLDIHAIVSRLPDVYNPNPPRVMLSSAVEAQAQWDQN